MAAFALFLWKSDFYLLAVSSGRTQELVGGAKVQQAGRGRSHEGVLVPSITLSLVGTPVNG